MKIKYNTKIPLLPGIRAITLFGNLYIKGSSEVSEQFINHERIHSKQWEELYHLGFILWYLFEWLVRFIIYIVKWAFDPESKFDWMHAYKNISLERESYENESNLNYLNSRKKYSFLKYI